MIIEKSIRMSQWDEDTRSKIVRYWQQRGVLFDSMTDDRLEGHRGSLLGNLTSYDMSKLMATLLIEHTAPDMVTCRLDVNTLMQDITEWNRAYWQLEMDTLESILLNGDAREEEWRKFLKESRAAAVRWTFSFFILGRKKGQL